MAKQIKENSGFLAFNFVCLCFAFVPLTSDYICAIYAILMPFFYKKNYGNPLKAVNLSSKLTIILMAFLIFQFVNVLRSDFKVYSFGIAALWLILFMGYIFVSNLADSKEKIEKILFTSTVAGGIVGAIGTAQMVLYHYGGLIHENLRFMFNPFWTFFHRAVVKLMAIIFPDSLAAHFGIDFDTARVFTFPTRSSSTFSNPIFCAMFLVIVLPIAMHCFFQLKGNKKKRIISAVSIVLIIIEIALSYTRAAYIATVIVVLVTLFCEKKQAIKTICVIPVVLLLIPSGAYKRLMTLLTNRQDISLTTHAKIYQAAFETIKEHGIFGIGTGNADFKHILYNDYGIEQPHAHNIFLEFIIEGGVIGAGLFIAALIVMVVSLIKIALKVKESRALCVTLIASLAGLVCCGMFDYVFYGPKPIQIFFMLIGLIEAICCFYQPQITKKT